MDPLNLLREWTKDGKLDRIRLGPERVEFADSYSFRRDAPTSYKSQKGKGAFYGLATLLVFLRNSKTPFPQYVKITKEENVPTVSYLDRKVRLHGTMQLQLLLCHRSPRCSASCIAATCVTFVQDVEAYLTGLSSSSDFIQLVAPDLNFAAIPAQQVGQQLQPEWLRADVATLMWFSILSSVRPGALPLLQAAPAAQSVEPAAKRARLDSQAAGSSAADGAGGAAPADTLMQQVERYERRLWDRNSAMTVPGKTFGRAVQLARDVLYANSRRPEPVRSSSRPQHRVSK